MFVVQQERGRAWEHVAICKLPSTINEGEGLGVKNALKFSRG